MSLTSQVSALATQLGTDIKAIIENIGTLDDLTTTEKSSLVAALNELRTYIASVESALGASIDDDATASSTTWSSSKISSAITEAIDALVNGAPEAMDTLKELADAIEENGDAITALQTIAAGHVKFSEAQSLTDEQKQQARDNIGAASAARAEEAYNAAVAAEGAASQAQSDAQSAIDTASTAQTTANEAKEAATAAETSATAAQTVAEAAQTAASEAKTTAEAANAAAEAASTTADAANTTAEEAKTTAEEAKAAVDGKAEASHTHEIADVNGLQDELDNRCIAVVESGNGKSIIQNESSGGGPKFQHTDGTHCYVGVNDGGADGIGVQAYVKDSSTNVGTRINIFAKGAYCIHNMSNEDEAYQADGDACKIAVMGDLDSYKTATIEAVDEKLGSYYTSEYVLNNFASKTEVTEALAGKQDAGDYITTTDAETKISEAIDSLVNGAPEAMDTLKELADAIEENGDAVTALREIAASHVSYTEAQSLTDAQKTTARTNIDAVSAAELQDAVAGVDLTAYLKSEDAASTYATIASLDEVKTTAEGAASAASAAQTTADSAVTAASAAQTTADSAASAASAAQTAADAAAAAVTAHEDAVGDTDTDFVSIYTAARDA